MTKSSDKSAGATCPLWLSAIFPGKVGCGYVRVAEASMENLPASERGLVLKSASPARVQQFAAGRLAAHHALTEIKVLDRPILRGDKGEPLWPSEVLGSISHTRHYALAIAAERRNYLALGVDLERIIESSNFEGLVKRVATSEESSWLREFEEMEKLRLTLLFSAKESLFKALFPLSGIYLGFHDASLKWNEETENFSVAFRKDVPALKSTPPIHIRTKSGDGMVAAMTIVANG